MATKNYYQYKHKKGNVQQNKKGQFSEFRLLKPNKKANTHLCAAFLNNMQNEQPLLGFNSHLTCPPSLPLST